MPDILIQPNADADDLLTNGVVIDDATLPLSNQSASALGLTLGTTYKARVLGAPETFSVSDVPDAFVDADWSVATGDGDADLDITIASLPAANGSTITDIEYDVDSSGTWISLGGTAGPFSIEMAAGETSYDIRLRAVNANGEGDPGNIEAATSSAASATPANTYIPDGSTPWTTPWVTDASTVTFDAGPPAADEFATVTGSARRMWRIATIDGTDISSLLHIEILVKLQAVTGDPDYRAFVRVSGATGSESAIGIRWNNGSKEMNRYLSGTFGSTSINSTNAPATAYLRVRATSSADFMVKGWDAAGAEPGAWEVSQNLGGRPAGGVGVMTFNGDTTTALLGISFSTAADLDANPAPMF